jgi:hypothetical protein
MVSSAQTGAQIVGVVFGLFTTLAIMFVLGRSIPNSRPIYSSWYASTLLATLCLWVIVGSTFSPIGGEIEFNSFVYVFGVYLFINLVTLVTTLWFMHRQFRDAVATLTFLVAGALFWNVSIAGISVYTRILRMCATILVVHHAFFDLYARPFAVVIRAVE